MSKDSNITQGGNREGESAEVDDSASTLYRSWRTSARGMAALGRFRVRAMLGAIFVYGGVGAYIARETVARDLNRSVGTVVSLAAILAAIGILMTAEALNRESAQRARFYEEQEAQARGHLSEALTDLRDIDDVVGLMRANRRQMDAYDAIARGQADASYRSSRLAMFGGLAVLTIGMGVTLFAPSSSTKYSAAVLTAVGAAIGGYIAQTFISVQQRAMDQLNFYFQQPLVQSYLIAAERVAERLPAKERTQALTSIVEVLVSKLLTSSFASPTSNVIKSKSRKAATNAGADPPQG